MVSASYAKDHKNICMHTSYIWHLDQFLMFKCFKCFFSNFCMILSWKCWTVKCFIWTQFQIFIPSHYFGSTHAIWISIPYQNSKSLKDRSSVAVKTGVQSKSCFKCGKFALLDNLFNMLNPFKTLFEVFAPSNLLSLGTWPLSKGGVVWQGSVGGDIQSTKRMWWKI